MSAHYFLSHVSFVRWLCPIQIWYTTEEEEDETDSEEELIELEDISHRTNLLFNRYNSIFENIQQQPRPIINERTFIQNISGIENEFIESRAMQNAIIASLYEQSGENNDSDNEEMGLENLYDNYDIYEKQHDTKLKYKLNELKNNLEEIILEYENTEKKYTTLKIKNEYLKNKKNDFINSIIEKNKTLYLKSQELKKE